jgi:phosphatidylglycerol:prolipoprotein diacylglycerol transferase
MIPELFHIGSFSVSPFGVFLALAFFVAYLQLAWGFRHLGIGTADDASALVLAGGVGGILGGKLYYAALYRDWSLLFERAGLVWYGGFLLGAAAVLWTARRRGLLRWPTLDAATPALAWGYSVGRIGCLLVGDDYGRPTDLPWGIAFPHGLPPTTAGYLRSEFGADLAASIPDAQLMRVHPTQIYETLAAAVIGAAGFWMLRKRVRPGTVALFTFAALAVERFLVEFVRAKDDRFFGPLTLAQAISLTILLVVGVLALRRPRPAPAGRPA